MLFYCQKSMTEEEKIKIAESCGLVGDLDNWIGSPEEWEKYDEELDNNQ